jgi:hypothetical protein
VYLVNQRAGLRNVFDYVHKSDHIKRFGFQPGFLESPGIYGTARAFSCVLRREVRSFHTDGIPSGTLGLLQHEAECTTHIEKPRPGGQTVTAANHSKMRASLCQAVLSITFMQWQIVVKKIFNGLILTPIVA